MASFKLYIKENPGGSFQEFQGYSLDTPYSFITATGVLTADLKYRDLD